MFSHDERKQLWTMTAGLLVILVGVAITVLLSRFVGVIITLFGSLILGAGGLRIAVALSHDDRKRIWIMLAGGLLGVIGFAMFASSIHTVGMLLFLIGVMTMFVGGVIIPVSSKYMKHD